MSVLLFHTENGSEETWLRVNNDGTVTYEVENTGWSMMREGANKRETTMTAAEAKAKWGSYAVEIDRALATIAGENL